MKKVHIVLHTVHPKQRQWHSHIFSKLQIRNICCIQTEEYKERVQYPEQGNNASEQRWVSRESKLLCSYLATRRLLLTQCLAPAACEELPKGPAVFITRGGEEEGKRKDIAAVLPQSLNRSFCCGVEEQDCLLLATETSWLYDDWSNTILHSGRGGHIAESFTGFLNYDQGSLLTSLDLSTTGSQNTVLSFFTMYRKEQPPTGLFL